MNFRLRLLAGTDRALAFLVAAVILGATLAFGGAVWWAPPALAVLTTLLVAAFLLRAALLGSWRLLKSPLPALGMLALLLAVVQLAPLPARLASMLSPKAGAAHTLGVIPGRATEDDPSLEIPESAEGRSALTVDRSATLRWLVGATGCLAVFCVVGHFTDRLGRTLLVWGSVVAGFAVNTAFGLVQWAGQAEGLYGFLAPGQGVAWGPSLADAVRSPGAMALRVLSEVGKPGAGWAVMQPRPTFLFGTLMGGPGAYLALAALGLPLGLALVLQALAPRGSRESLWARLGQSGQAGLVALLGVLILVGAMFVGLLAGALLSVPFAIGVLLVGIPSARATGLGWSAVGLTLGVLLALGLGVILGDALGRPAGISPLASAATRPAARQVWADAARIAHDFPLFGSGLGSFPAIYPHYKTRDLGSTTALSSLLQWGVEAGVAGLALLALGGLWCIARLPGAIRRVGTADRALAFGLVGALTCFAAFSAVHWTVELAAVALAACAVGGTCNRWLAGGTDLFVQKAC